MAHLDVVQGVAVVRVDCPVSIDQQERLGALVKEGLDAGHTLFAFDLGGCRTVDSSGVSLLMFLNEQVAQAGGRLALFGANRMVSTVFETLRVDGLVSIRRTEREALELLSSV